MVGDLIYDVGMHDGRDTAHYLRCGYRVVAVEANPELVAAAEKRFGDVIAAGRLTIVPKAVAAKAGTVKFWVNDDKSSHSSTFVERAARSNSRHHVIEVESVPFAEVLREHGVPHYLKLDIEMSDSLCVAALEPPDLPAYISVEAHSLTNLTDLAAIGYTGFKVIDQENHSALARRSELRELGLRARRLAAGKVPALRYAYAKVRPGRGRLPATYGSSGPFGEDTDGGWLTLEDAAYLWLRVARAREQWTWFDFHARHAV